MKKIDLSVWPRAEHFKFFLPFNQPYFNVVLDVEVKSLFEYAKSEQISFTACYLYCLHEAIARYAPIRYRIVDEHPVEVENVVLSTVFLKEDESFRFVPLKYKDGIKAFNQHYDKQKQLHLNKTLINPLFLETAERVEQVYISILPWFKFTGFKHAEHTSMQSGIPKIVFGKYQKEQGTMPISIEVHHALMDGLHISQFIDVFIQVIAEISAKN
jgi:chloramphenicol O-acetyltransferase type A